MAAAACDPEVSVAKLALEHGVNANLLFRWRRQYRMGLFGAADATPERLPALRRAPEVPSEVDGSIKLLPVQVPEPDCAVPPTCIEVQFSCATIRICGRPEAATLRVVLETLARQS